MPEYRASPFLTVISPLIAGMLLVLAGLAAAAGLFERFLPGLAVFILMVGGALYWLFAAASAPHTALIANDRLIIQRWLGRSEIACADILSIRQTYRHIILQTTDGSLFLHKLNANDDALLFRMLESSIPALSEARSRRLAVELPVILKGSPAGPIFSGVCGLGLLAFSLLLAWQALTGGLPSSDRGFILLFCLLTFAIGIFLVLHPLRSFAYRTEFTRTQMTRFCALRTLEQLMTGLQRIEKSHYIRTFRNIPRRIYTLTFHFENREPFTWIPDDLVADWGYVDAAAQNRVNDLAEMLEYAYLKHPHAEGAKT